MGTKEQKLKTLPWLLLFFYPQYKAMRIIYLWWKNDQSWTEEKLQLERDIVSVEPFVEAVPQVFVQLTILAFSFDEQRSDVYGIINPSGRMFLASFTISVLSATLGIAKFLKTGHCQLVPNEFYGCGFISTMLITLISLLMKGAQFYFFIRVQSNLPTGIMIWIGLFIFPHIIYALILMVISVGWKKTFSELVPRSPGFLIMPALTCFTFGPVNFKSSGQGFCCYGGDSFDHFESREFGLSFDLSWINIGISCLTILLSPLLYLVSGDDAVFDFLTPLVFPLAFANFFIQIIILDLMRASKNFGSSFCINCIHRTVISTQEDQPEQEMIVIS